MKIFFKRFLSMIISLAIGLAIGEASLRIFYYNKRKFCVHPPNLQTVFKPAPGVMPGVSGSSHFTTNSMGIRGDEFDEKQKYRILVMGGSTAECLYLDDEEAWPFILQQKLNSLGRGNAWVGNIGASGKTTRDNIMHMKHLLGQYPKIDAVIILAGINDFALRLERNEKYDPDFTLNPEAKQKQLEHAFYVCPFRKEDDYYYENFAIYKLVRRARDIYSKKEDTQDRAGAWYAGKRATRQKADEIINEPPDIEEALAEYGRNINLLIDMAKKKSIRVIFLTQPYMWNPGLSEEEKNLCWWGWVDKNGEKYYSFEALARGLDEYNGILIDICKSRGVECIDLAKKIPKSKDVFYDDVHFNEKGSRVVAETIFEYLENNRTFKENE